MRPLDAPSGMSQVNPLQSMFSKKSFDAFHPEKVFFLIVRKHRIPLNCHVKFMRRGVSPRLQNNDCVKMDGFDSLSALALLCKAVGKKHVKSR